jgi:SHOCT-like protein
MNLKEERMQILRMIQSGQISADEGAKLLAALEDSKKSEAAANVAAAQGKFLRVRVTDMNSGRTRVNVNVPLALVNVGLKMGAKFIPDLEGMDANEIMDAIRSGAQGKIVDVEDMEDGEKVEVYIE